MFSYKFGLNSVFAYVTSFWITIWERFIIHAFNPIMYHFWLDGLITIGGWFDHRWPAEQWPVLVLFDQRAGLAWCQSDQSMSVTWHCLPMSSSEAGWVTVSPGQSGICSVTGAFDRRHMQRRVAATCCKDVFCSCVCRLNACISSRTLIVKYTYSK